MAAMDAMFGKKKAPKFAGEKPPSGSEEPRGAASGSDEMPAMAPGSGGADDLGATTGDVPDADPQSMALDELADIVGIAPQDKDDFGNAMMAFVHACLADAQSGDEGGEGGEGGMGGEGGDEQE